jgi:hypothetical protein
MSSRPISLTLALQVIHEGVCFVSQTTSEGLHLTDYKRRRSSCPLDLTGDQLGSV